MSQPNKEQIELAKRLQMYWLEEMENRFKAGEITSTDMATLARVLMRNGWTLDPSQLPEDLREKLSTTNLDFEDPPLEEEIHGARALT